MKIINKTIILLFTFFLLFNGPYCFSKVWINEIMQSNVDTVWDDLMEFPDSWIELYNDQDFDINIQGWYISISENYLDGWLFNESIIIPASGYLLIYCDKVGQGHHTNFRLESIEEGEIYLFNSDGEIEDLVNNIPKQPAPNISFGRVGDGGENWEYFITSTPLAENSGPTSDQLSLPPVFDIQGGIYHTALTLSLSLPLGVPSDIEQKHIYYTLDGTEPTINSSVYIDPIIISSSTVVKAKIISPNYLIDRAVVHSYIIVDRDLFLPVISISLNPEYLWDEFSGIYVKGNGENGSGGKCGAEIANYNENWRRPMNIEYFVDNKRVLNQLGEMRIAGGCSRQNAQKSLVLYAHERFGEKRYNYPLFQEKENQKIKSFMLRNSGNDFGFAHFRDAVIQLFMGNKVDIDYQSYQPAILYINGEYFGIQNIRERSQDDFVYANYDGLKDIDIIENWQIAKTGDMNDFNDLMEKIQLPEEEIPYDEIMDKIDITEFINYYILHVYSGNRDFPFNNVVMWKPKLEDSKWRFILKDLDASIGLGRVYGPEDDLFDFYLKEDFSYLLFFKLMKNNNFKKEFYDRFSIYLGNILNYNTVATLIDIVTQKIEEEMPWHLKRWSGYMFCNNMMEWEQEISYMKDWCLKRNDVLYSQLSHYFNLGEPVPVSIEIPDEFINKISLSVNDLSLTEPIFDGKYFRDEILDLRWNILEENDLVGWKIELVYDNYRKTIREWGENCSLVIPSDCKKVIFSVHSDEKEVGEIPGIGDESIMYTTKEGIMVYGIEPGAQIVLYDISGKMLKRFDVSVEGNILIPIHSKGLYTIKILSNQSTITRKILI